MERDRDLIYRILKYAEKHADGQPMRVDLQGYDCDLVHYHVGLCGEAGFLKVVQRPVVSPAQFKIVNLTWQGHNALAQLKKDSLVKTRFEEVPAI